MSEPQIPPAPNCTRTIPGASGAGGVSITRRSSAPNSVAERTVSLISITPIVRGSQSVSSGM